MSHARRSFAAFLSGLPAVFSQGLPRAFFAKGSACSNTFLTGSGSQTEIAVTHSKQTAGEFLTGSRIACQRVLSRLNKPSSLRVLETEKSCANEPAGEVSRSPYFLKTLSKKPTCLNHSFRAGSPARAFVSSRPLENGTPSTHTIRVNPDGIHPERICEGREAAFLTGSGSQTEIDVTYSKQSTDEFLTGSRIARCAFRTLQRAAHLRPSTLNICEGGRFAGVVSRNTGRGPRSTCLNALSLHLTNCRLNRLQLLRHAGVRTKRRLQQITVCADKVFGGFICR